jgi:hypothetical protein
MLTNTNKQGTEDTQQGKDIVKFTKCLWLRLHSLVKRMQNQIMPKQIATSTMEGTSKRGRRYKRERD